MTYSRCGRSGLLLPAISLGLWQNFGGDRPLETSRAIVRRAFDLGITHFDLANNYGPPYGSAEETFGRAPAQGPRALPRRARDLDEGRLRHVARPLRRSRLAQVPAGQPRPEPAAHGPRLRRHLLLAPARPRDAAGGDARRAGHRRAPGQGAVRGHLLLLGGAHAPRRPRSCASSGRRCSSTSPRTRCSTAGSSAACWTSSASRASAASSSRRSPRACSPTATSTASRPARAPAATARSRRDMLTEQALEKIRALDGIAKRRGQTLAQMALAWTLRDPRVTSALVGASSVAAARGQRRRARPARLHGRRARGDRSSRDRQRHQPLGRIERRMSAGLRTPLCDLLGIRVPILLAGMARARARPSSPQP